jgi:hypothetical protein
MVTLDDATVTALLDNVIQGKWDRKLFLAQCKFYKCQLDLKRQILDWMVTAGHFNVRGSWEDLCAKYPKGDLNALVDTWSNALKDSKMAERRVLPTNLAEALTQIANDSLRVLAFSIYTCVVGMWYMIFICVLHLQPQGDGTKKEWTFNSVTFTLHNVDMFTMASAVPHGKYGTCTYYILERHLNFLNI